jgi:hypothetical protein
LVLGKLDENSGFLLYQKATESTCHFLQVLFAESGYKKKPRGGPILKEYLYCFQDQRPEQKAETIYFCLFTRASLSSRPSMTKWRNVRLIIYDTKYSLSG